ncbi:type IV-A pilus assembly ATPase PilB [Inmirania thermothiophila]|uniref:Type IV pilus assembly protein PilB n=1 Tax=Inmirania thermothiophila TaxID=1750597 RepID=A0A3N1XU54_9GAMM|nr:type IV-A pilus assembly ATPase PilB [Inmirania thermothiophila]ROR29701.1 type IV pilus assembly protein PilB [Inmirania thermothiophila]
MATTQPIVNLPGLARRLVQDGLLPEEEARKALQQAARQRTSLVGYLVENKLVSARAIAASASQEFGLPLLDLDAMDLEVAPVKLVNERLIRQHRILPLYKRGNRLYVAVSDPTNQRGLDEVRFHTALITQAILVEEDKLAAAIDRVLEAQDTTMTDLMDEDLDNLDIGTAEEAAEHDEAEPDIDDAPVVRFVNKVLLDAIKKGASDIHFEPYERFFRVRFRQDGILHEIASPPVALAPRIAARIKVMARLDVSERRIPQDGRIKMKLSRNRAIDFRVNTCPTLWGEKVVLRILDPSSAKMGIDALGFEKEQKRLFLEAIHKPYGMVLVTGPTGSGKTVTLYTAINILNQPNVNISTVEDPVEINVPGINQVNVDDKTGMDFAKALRAFLRQDPDIILVGEIRDLETAEIAVKAAQTGHLVLSTLHTNDAPQTLTRLASMGVPPYNIANTVHLIIAQRLARRLCGNCKREVQIPRDELLREGFTEDEVEEGITLYEPAGCDQCTDGYKGRVGIYQVMPVSEEMGRIIMEGGNAMQLAEQAEREGVADLRRSGLNKVKAGITSLAEINRVTKD